MSRVDLLDWRVEDNQFWESTGKKIALRNILISIPSLLCGFAVWLMWGIIIVQMGKVGFKFDVDPEANKNLLPILMIIAGLSGATLRIPSTFFIRLAGGRNTIFYTTSLLLIPAFGAAIALMYKTDVTTGVGTPFWVFQVLALTSGFGGGNFASSMSNISFFFPKKVQGTSLGFNAGIGNFGVSVMQFGIPIIITSGFVASWIGADVLKLLAPSGHAFKTFPAGSLTYISNAGWMWVIPLVILGILGFIWMNNIKTQAVSPDIKGALGAIGKITLLLIFGFIFAAIGLYFILPPKTPWGIKVASWAGENILKNSWLWLFGFIIPGTVLAMRYLVPFSSIRESLKRQYRIFHEKPMAKHTWAMTIIYTMTFGSFIGYAAAFPFTINNVFGFVHDPITGQGIMNPALWEQVSNVNGPSALQFAWIGAFIGSLIRPIGGYISDKLGGARVTEWIAIGMVIFAIGVGFFMDRAYHSPTPETEFVAFFILFLLLFAMTGIGNGSTFRTIGVAFNEEQAGPVLGWTSAVAAYGAFLIPNTFNKQIAAGTPFNALIGFAAFYFICILINRWFYLRKNAYIKNP